MPLRDRIGVVSVLLLAGSSLWAAEGPKPKQEKAEGYLEWREGDLLVVDGQRVKPAPGAKFKGKQEARSIDTIPLGYELKAEGTRDVSGVLLAREIEAKPNGSAMFESDVLNITNEAESNYRRAGSFYQGAAGGRMQSIGRLYESGPQVDRVRRIVDTLLPPYVSPDQVRVYVIENKEWNAFAMGNYSIYVFSGLLNDADDDELAMVLGHELVHASHEHTRRQFKKQMWIQLAALGIAASAESIDDKNKRAVAQLLTQFGAAAWSNGYGRDLEDQADRVGMRYAYEAGYDITKGPRLWNRFAKKYGESGKVANFFFSDHSLASARAANLEKELAFNYPDGAKGGNTAKARMAATAAAAPRRSNPPVHAAPGAVPAGASALAAPGLGRTESKEIKAGMTADQVRGVLGAPREEVVFGNRTKWSYPDLTVIFEAGKVKEVRF